MEVIGEAVERLSSDLQAEHPDVPWSAMARMRDLLIHAYDKVDLDEVWDAVQKDIPALISSLEPLIPPENSS